ncbi:MAG TPA: hypothetical protein VGR59_07285 [Gemmatimonadaceae bacterium]|nr:hypothetical protein [Gemmatimonadaceae bacterium]
MKKKRTAAPIPQFGRDRAPKGTPVPVREQRSAAPKNPGKPRNTAARSGQRGR